ADEASSATRLLCNLVAELRCPPANSAGAAAAHLRRLLPERRVGERLQRLVQRRELACQLQEVLVVVDPPVELRELVADPVEPLEEDVEAPVGEIGLLHGVILGTPAARESGRRRFPRRARPGPRAAGPAPRSAAPHPGARGRSPRAPAAHR